MQDLKTVAVTSKTPCTILRGEGFFRLGEGLPLLLPASGDSRLAFTLWGDPSPEGVPVPSLVTLELSGGSVKSTSAPLIDWGDLLELEAVPRYVRLPPRGRPRVLSAAGFGREGRAARAELFLDGGLYLALTAKGAAPVSVPLGEGTDGRLRVIDFGGERMLAAELKKETGEGIAILDPEGTVILEEEGDFASVEEGYPTVIRRTDTVRGWEERTRFEFMHGAFRSLGKELGFFRGEERAPGSEPEAALSIAEDLLLGSEKWRELLSKELSAELGQGSLGEFLGEYSEARLYPLEEREGRATVGLCSETGVVSVPRRFVFAFEGGLLTDVYEI